MSHTVECICVQVDLSWDDCYDICEIITLGEILPDEREDCTHVCLTDDGDRWRFAFVDGDVVIPDDLDDLVKNIVVLRPLSKFTHMEQFHVKLTGRLPYGI